MDFILAGFIPNGVVAVTFYILQESGDTLLQENGDNLLLE
jgi:hypothetical protein